MGLIRFLVPDRCRLADDALPRVHMSGLDEVPWPTSPRWDGDLLVLEPPVRESGNVHCPWRTTTGSELVLSTCSLMQRSRPYLLDVELARGMISQVRNHMAVWEAAGLAVPRRVTDRLRQANRTFAQAVAIQNQPAAAAEKSRQALDATIQAAAVLGESYARQAIAAQCETTTKLTTLLGVNLGRRPVDATTAGAVEGVFHLALVPLPWQNTATQRSARDWTVADQQIEWCRQHDIKVCAGPLLELDPRGLPTALEDSPTDFDAILPSVVEHVRAAVTRYRGRVHVWEAAARVNLGTALNLAEHEQLEILIRTLETVRELDRQAALIVSIDQPWAEYMTADHRGLAPFPFADALLRTDLGIAGLGLEINYGYYPGGTMPRTALAVSRQLDRWALLGTPLVVFLTAPGQTNEGTFRPAAGGPIGPDAETPRPLQPLSAGNQRMWAARFVPTILANSSVQVLIWNQLRDSDPYGFPSGGLLDASGRAKPVVDALRSIREEYLV